MYKKPITIQSNDPVCSATSLGNNVIGILFDKTGEAIRRALEARIKAIKAEEQTYAGLAEPLREFLKDKEAEIAEAEAYEKERLHQRTKALEKDRAKVSEAEKAMRKILEKEQEKLDAATEKLAKSAESFDEETETELEAREAGFREGWDQIKEHLETVKSFEAERRWSEIAEACKIQEPCSSSMSSCSYSASSKSGDALSRSNWQNCDGDYDSGIRSSRDSRESGEVKLAVSHRLRDRHRRYMTVFDDIKAKLEQLREERRKLELIFRNVDPERSYKLDMNKLSAFGFEDLEIE
jgi:hypothetical protein